LLAQQLITKSRPRHQQQKSQLPKITFQSNTAALDLLSFQTLLLSLLQLPRAMADVEMKDAGPTTKAKSVSRSAKSGAADSAADGKKRFEVKKVGYSTGHCTGSRCSWTLSAFSGTPLLSGHGISSLTTAPSAETISWISVRYCPSILFTRPFQPAYTSSSLQASNVRPTRAPPPQKNAPSPGESAT
jgi:hypothetical protein